MVPGDEAAHHPHVAGGAFELGLRGFQVAAGGFDIFLCAGYVCGYGADLGFAFLLGGGNLLTQSLVGSRLLLADRFSAALGVGEFGLGHTDFLGGNVDLSLEIGNAGIGLLELSRKNFVLLFGLGKLLLHPGPDRISSVSEHSEPGDQQTKQHQNPARGSQILVVIRFLGARHIRRNAHSPSSGKAS